MVKTDIFDVVIIPEELTVEDRENLRTFEWESQRSYTGQLCYLTGEKIRMFDKAVKGTAILRDSQRTNEHVQVVRWATEKAVLFHRLKGNIT